MAVPVVSPEEMRALEQAVFDVGVDSFAVMQVAGEAVAAAVNEAYPKGAIRVLCGPGGNGGDGFVAAAWLARHGRTVRVYCAREVGALSGDVAQAAGLWAGPVMPLREALEDDAAVTVDALFGGGLSRPLEGVAAALARQSGAPSAGGVVSVDVPSGVDGGAAVARGAAFKADLTVTFAALRHAHVFEPASTLCGRVVVADIGVPVDTQLWQLDEAAFQARIDRLDPLRVEPGGIAAEGALGRVNALRDLAAERGVAVLHSGDEAVLVEADGSAFVCF